eukprot:3582047-Rhodomonas_salina.1
MHFLCALRQSVTGPARLASRPSNGQDTMKSSPDGSSAQGLQGVQSSTLASSAGAGAAQVDIVRVPEQEAGE